MIVKNEGKFSKSFLMKALRFTEEEAKHIMTVQRRFPEIIGKDVDEKGFVVDGEKLCKELDVKSNFNDWLLRKSKGKEGKLIKGRFVENTDFTSTSEKSETQNKEGKKGITIKNKITLTLDCAKKIAMRQNNEAGDMICDYFILMEKAIRNRIDWFKIRHPEKESYKRMCKALEMNYIYLNGRKPKNGFIYAKEADMINEVIFNKTSKQMKSLLEVKYDDLLRDSLVTDANTVIHELQIANISSLLNIRNTLADRRLCLEKYIELKFNGFRDRFFRAFEKELKGMD